MKELSIEEKAKAYDEAKLRMSAAYNSNRCTIGFMNEIFPELKDEDERIRKEIIYHIQNCDDTIDEVTEKRMLAWLERQGEHANFRNKIQIGDKVTRDEDGVLVNLSQLNRVAKKQTEQKLYVNDNAKEMFIKALERVEEQNNKGYKLTDCDKNSWWEDFKAYTSCIIEQKPAEWSEEDEKKLLCICAWIKDYPRIADFKDEMYTVANNYIDWLKSLRPQSQWKPSEEQIRWLYCAMDDAEKGSRMKQVLYELLEQLKKLND